MNVLGLSGRMVKAMHVAVVSKTVTLPSAGKWMSSCYLSGKHTDAQFCCSSCLKCLFLRQRLGSQVTSEGQINLLVK